MKTVGLQAVAFVLVVAITNVGGNRLSQVAQAHEHTEEKCSSARLKLIISQPFVGKWNCYFTSDMPKTLSVPVTS